MLPGHKVTTFNGILLRRDIFSSEVENQIYTTTSSLKMSSKGYQMHFLETDSSGRGTDINGYKDLMLREQTSASMWDTVIYGSSIPS